MTLTAKPLWPHQAAELPRLDAGHRLLAWEPGTGKTRAVLDAFAKLPKPRRMLVIVPANIRTQWAEIAREYGFTVQEIRATWTTVDAVSEIVVVSYHGIIRKNVWQSAMRQRWDVLTLDEAHYCKTPSTKWTKAIFGARKNTPACLMRRAKRLWLLTGTPLLKDPSDLWVIVSRVFPDVLTFSQPEISNRQDWIARWCTGYDTPYGFKITGARNPELLHALLKPYMSRVKKRDVMPWLKEPIFDRFHLPPRRIEITADVSEALRDFLLTIENGDDEEVALLAEQMEPQVATLRRAIGLSKAGEIAEQIADELANTPDQKALVFFLHTDVGRAILDKLANVGLRPVMFDGKTSRTARERNLKAFVSDPDVRVFVGQIGASGTGTDGLQVASRVFIAEEPWTPGALNQVVSRADRGGQVNQVFVTSFVVSGSYDERVSKALANRARMVGQVIDGDNDNHNPLHNTKLGKAA